MKRCQCGGPGEYQIGGAHICHTCIQIKLPQEMREETYRLRHAKGERPEIPDKGVKKQGVLRKSKLRKWK